MYLSYYYSVCRLHIPGSGAAKRLLDFLLMQKSDVNLVSASSAAATGRKEESRDGEMTEQLYMYRVGHLLGNLGWVDFNLCCYTQPR